MKRAAVSGDLVHLKHRGYVPTALRLSPLQFRVLKMVQTGYALETDATKRPKAWLQAGSEEHRMHLATYKALRNRGMIAREHGHTVLTLIAIAALEVYAL